MQNCIACGHAAARTRLQQMIRIMKLTAFVLLAGCLHVAARGLGQDARVTLHMKQVSLDKFFSLVEKQTSYHFSYSTALIPLNRKIDVEARDETLASVLQRVLQELGLSYKMMNEKVIGITTTPADIQGTVHITRKTEDIYGSFFADTIVIRGTVYDDKGAPLPRASVMVKGTGKGVHTDNDGRFSIGLPRTAGTLVISSVGFTTLEQVLTPGRKQFDVVLQPAASALSEVVVVAYGTAKKGTLTGSVAQINSEKFASRPLTNPLNALDGAAPGVQLSTANGQPGSAPTIRIRGFGSVNASNAPLYVVDGVIYDGTIANLNPDDIDNFSILKDASATSLYGAKAANGVIMITTKKGKSGSGQLQVRATQGYTTRGIAEYDRVNAYQYYPLMWEAYRNSLVNATAPIPMDDAGKLASGVFPRNSGNQQVYNGKTYSDISQLLMNNPFNVAGNELVRTDGTLNPNAKLMYADDLDWYKQMSRTGNRKEYNLSASGGSEKNDYYVSLAYNKEKGFVIRSDYERITGRINVNSRPVSWFKTGANIAGTITRSNQASDGSSTGFVNPFYFSRTIGPIYPVHQHDASGNYVLDQKGEKVFELGVNRASGGKVGRNVVAETLWNQDFVKRNVLSGRTYGEISLLKNLKFTTNITVDISNYNNPTYTNKIVGDGSGDGGRASNTNSTTTSYTFNQLLNYNKTFHDHTLQVLAGHENYDYTYKYAYGSRAGQVLDGNTELINFTNTTSLTSYTYNDRTESYLSRVNYDYKNKYMLSGSFRTDGSSRFYKDSRWGKFWSVGAAWRLDQEDFAKKISWLESLKLRASYGLVGNNYLLNSDGTDIYYAWQALYTLGRNNVLEPGYVQASLENRDLKWETNKQLDLGVDFGLFKDRLTGSIEYFDRKSVDLLYSVPLPVSAGLDTKNMNIGTMYNRGFEIQLTGHVVKSKNFAWDVDLNWTTFKNQITSQPVNEIIDGTKKLMVGHNRYEYWLRQWYGVNPETGDGLYVANSWNASNSFVTKGGDTVTTNPSNARYVYAGSAIPKFYGSISNSFTYKNFKFSFLISYQVGGKVYDGTYAGIMSSGNYGEALHTDILKRWQKPGDITDVPRLDYGQVSNYGAQSSRFLVSASYLNFRSVNLAYTFSNKLASELHVKGAQLYGGVENLGLISARKGLNPMQSFTGVTSNAYVPARIFVAGLTVSL
jgi:TonB-linked SusC/RagA family outer membrane protein